MTKAERSVSKQGHLQLCCHYTEQTTMKWSFSFVDYKQASSHTNKQIKRKSDSVKIKMNKQSFKNNALHLGFFVWIVSGK